eukprot:UN17907
MIFRFRDFCLYKCFSPLSFSVQDLVRIFETLSDFRNFSDRATYQFFCLYFKARPDER